ncbi:uncharacterized protein, partial [Palaemon carinicauda]|uniref:uncharacterized protein n=1 Tax=Palaemon carinicauda TaxID=392227 RepID=UPI0035B59D73
MATQVLINNDYNNKQVQREVRAAIDKWSLTVNEILAELEKEDIAADVFIKPADDGLTDEDSADEDQGGLIDNLSGKQLDAAGEAALPNEVWLGKWMDNSVVTITSTAHGREPLSKVKRYSKKEKKNIEVDCPLVIREYNNHMGGTDRQDQNVNNYRVSIR